MTDEEIQTLRSISAREYRALIAALGMNITDAGRYLGVSPRQGRRYVEGTRQVRPAEVLLLRLLEHKNIEPLVPLPPRKD